MGNIATTTAKYSEQWMKSELRKVFDKDGPLEEISIKRIAPNKPGRKMLTEEDDTTFWRALTAVAGEYGLHIIKEKEKFPIIYVLGLIPK
jgi:hypothetical protein